MRLLTIRQTAMRLAVSESTIRRMLKDPMSPLRGVAVHKGCIRVVEASISDVVELLTLKKMLQQ